MKHTKGPWTYQDHRDNHFGLYDWHWGFTIRDKRNIGLATVGHIDASVKNESEANARLIAAAPDLLATCKTMDSLMASRWWLDEKKSTIDWQKFRNELQQAIKKAEGRE